MLYWCNSYTIGHFYLDIVEKGFKLYLILIHPPLSVNKRDKFIVIYLDDLTVFSKCNAEHLKHLKKTFEKCRKFGLSLNPKKSHFMMQEGKRLGHIVSKEGIKIDPKRVEAIDTINLPRNVKEIQSFLGKINFLRRFIPNFAEIVKLITDMLKTDSEVRWTNEAKASFQCIKKVISETLVLASLDYMKDVGCGA
jgi:hypothetical protein